MFFNFNFVSFVVFFLPHSFLLFFLPPYSSLPLPYFLPFTPIFFLPSLLLFLPSLLLLFLPSLIPNFLPSLPSTFPYLRISFLFTILPSSLFSFFHSLHLSSRSRNCALETSLETTVKLTIFLLFSEKVWFTNNRLTAMSIVVSVALTQRLHKAVSFLIPYFALKNFMYSLWVVLVNAGANS